MSKISDIKKKVIPYPDRVSYTDSEGNKQSELWELFDVDLVAIECQDQLDLWLSRINQFIDMPQADKFTFYQHYLYQIEKMICNWQYLTQDYPMYAFDVSKLKGYDRYLPIMPNKVYLQINSFQDYDEMGISWKQWLAEIDEYLLKNFPEDYKSAEDSIEKIKQAEVDELLDACLTDFKHELTDRQRMIIQNKKSYSGMSSKWVNNLFNDRKLDKESNWLNFESQIGKRPVQTYKLGAIINPNKMSPKLHFLIQDKLKGMFINWFQKKHIGELQVSTHMISAQDPNKQKYFEEHLLIVKNPKFNDEERAQELSEQRLQS